ARMALAYAGILTDQKEVDLKNKPLELIMTSSKATVPVLKLENGHVIDESIDIMRWALKQSDPDGWLEPALKAECDELVYLNDTSFKPILDNYKYPQRAEKKEPIYYRDKATNYLNRLNILLMQHQYLLADHITFADVALFPFIRQFYLVDQQWFEQSDYKLLNIWLASFLNADLFLSVMKKGE
ncbi:MAG: glutathione S-transferase, partial [bacterium]|nr:glutathione S-transferase [bacterium]